jgi:hypothetical protein
MELQEADSTPRRPKPTQQPTHKRLRVDERTARPNQIGGGDDQEVPTTVYIVPRNPTLWAATNTDSYGCTKNSTNHLTAARFDDRI